MFIVNKIPKKDYFKDYLYVLEINDGTIKIGYTKNLRSRIQYWKEKYVLYNKDIVNYASIQLFNAESVEAFLHDKALYKYSVKSPITCESYNIKFEDFINIVFPAIVYVLKESYSINIQ